MDAKLTKELSQKYIKIFPGSITFRLIRDMTDSNLLDMHAFLIEDNDLDDDEFEESFYIGFFITICFPCPLLSVFLLMVQRTSNFPIIQQKHSSIVIQ